MNARKVIIDCDPGIDDALALMLAVASPELEILGITVVSGNVPARQGVENALKVLKWMGRLDIPVYLGEELPLGREYVDARDTHGEDGLGESAYPDVTEVRPRVGAVSFLEESLKKNEKISIIALGPLTNIARLISRAPEALAGLDEFVSMGGSYKSHGNCSPVAEYNYWCDPHAARAVFAAFEERKELRGKKVHMVGLDVTRKIVLTPNLLEYMQFVNPQMGEIIRKITRFYFDFHWKQEGVIGCVINDPLAVAYFIDRSLCSGFESYTLVETEGDCIGQTVADAYGFWKKEANSYILTWTDTYGFMKFFLKRVINAQEPEIDAVLRQIIVPVQTAGSVQMTKPVQTVELVQMTKPIQTAVPGQMTLPGERAVPGQRTEEADP